MADYPFRINTMPKNGEGTIAFYTSSLVTSDDALVSASIMVEKINLMPSASYEDGVISGSSTAFAHKFGGGRNLHLSASYSDPNVGTITFTDKEVSTDGGLDYYTFWGTKVCSVLGLPEGIPIYTENFKLSDSASDPDNYLSGRIISDAVAIKDSIKLSPQARVRSNLVWDEEFGEGLVQWVSGSSTELRIGYDNVNDNYKIRGNGYTSIEGMGNIGTTNAPTPSGSFLKLNTAYLDLKPGGSTLYIGQTTSPAIIIGNDYGLSGDAPTTGAGNLVGVFLGSNTQIKMTAGAGDGSDAIAELTTTGMNIEYTNTATFANTATDTQFQLVLRNNTDTSNAFVGIAFQAEAGFNADRLNAAIFAEREDSGAGDVNSDLVFAVNNDADDDLFERMRLSANGDLALPDGHFIGGGTRGYFFFGESGTKSSTAYLDMAQAEQASSTKGVTMPRAGSLTGVSVNFNISAHSTAAASGRHSFVTFDVRKNGSLVWATTIAGASGGATTYNNGVVDKTATQAIGTDTFAAGDTIQAVLTFTNYTDSSTSSTSIEGTTAYIEFTFDN